MRQVVFDERVHHAVGDVGHDHEVADALERGNLPAGHDFVGRTGEDHGDGVLAERGRDAGGFHAELRVAGDVEAVRHGALQTGRAEAFEGVPQHDRGEGVPGAGEGGVQDAHVLDAARDAIDVLALGEDDAARHGRAEELVAAEAELLEHPARGADVVDGPFHRGADVQEQDRRYVAVNAQGLFEVLQVDGAALLAADHDAAHAEHAQALLHGVVGVLRVVDDAARVHLAGQIEAVHVALGAAVRNVAPDVLAFCAGELGKAVHDVALDVVRAHAVVRGGERITDVVERVTEEREELAVVEGLVTRVADLRLARAVDAREQGVESAAGRRRQGAPARLERGRTGLTGAGLGDGVDDAARQLGDRRSLPFRKSRHPRSLAGPAKKAPFWGRRHPATPPAMLDYGRPKSWLRLVFSVRGSALIRIRFRLLAVALISLVLTIRHEIGHIHTPLTLQALSLMGLALGIFLGFRNNTSYDRFWEGRRLWGALVNVSRTLTRDLLTVLPPGPQGEPSDVQRRQVHRLIAFVHALRMGLRDQTNLDEIGLLLLLAPGDLEAIGSHRNVPNGILLRMAGEHRALKNADQIGENWSVLLAERLSALSDIQG